MIKFGFQSHNGDPVDRTRSHTLSVPPTPANRALIEIQVPGRTENCQIGVFAAYATTRGHALVDRELYLPKSWTADRERCQAARIPDDRAFATKGDLARDMIRRALASPLPIAWVTADSAYGQDSRFQRFLEDAQLAYVVAVPKSQQVNGPRIDHLIAQAPPKAWQRLSAGPGAKGERFYDWAAARLPAVAEPDAAEPTRQRWILARRSISRPDESAYYLACAPLDATVADLVRVAGCRWKIEECFQNAKNECGLDEYEVRRYVGWYRHITLAMLAHAFLAVMAVQEREKGVTRPIHPTSWSSHQPKSVVCWQLNPAAILHAATTRRTGPDGDASTKHAPDTVITCGAGTRSRDGQPKAAPTPPNPRYTPHRQAVDQDKYKSPAGVLAVTRMRLKAEPLCFLG
ncbi:IS701 family transposase [Streptomyces sp. ISL-100]|uniref:IS701 family transposase n=1 Tax=Streptomyces sp. ISL-100 TaxID=2819173 RepID=UPI0020352B26|nr:IS701 family transposase [Streptomyces sp. ISL-100]